MHQYANMEENDIQTVLQKAQVPSHSILSRFEAILLRCQSTSAAKIRKVFIL